MALKIVWKIVEITVKFVVFLLALVMIAAIGLLATVYFFDINAHRFLIERQFKQVTGNVLNLNGPIAISLTPVPTVHLTDVSLLIKSKDFPIAIMAKKFDFKINPVNIFSDYIHIWGVSATGLTISSQQNGTAWKKDIELFSGDIDTAFQKINFSNVKMRINQTTYAGDFHLVFIGSRAQLGAELKTPEWTYHPTKTSDLTSLLMNDRFSAKIHWRCGALHYDRLEFKDVDAQFTKEPHQVTVKANAGVLNGKSELNLIITDFKNIPQFKGNATLHLNDPKPMLHQWIPELQLEAHGLKLSIDGTSQGADLTAIKQHFDGRIEGVFSDLHLKTGSDLNLNQVQFQLKFKSKEVAIESQGNLPGGTYKGDFWIKNWPEAPYIVTDLRISAQDSAAFLKSFAPALKVTGGNMNVHLQGSAQGKNFAEWKSRFKGHLFMHIQNMTVLGQSIDARLVDLFALFTHLFQHEKQQETLFECMASRFIVHDGILMANDNFAVETPEIYALGAGSINFNREWLSLSFDVYPREKLPLQIGAYDNVVSIRGPFSDPNVSTGGNGLIAKGGSIALSIATSGLSSLVQSFIEIVKDKGSPCAKVLAIEKQEDQLAPVSAEPHP